MDKIQHFEIPTKNKERAKKFYGNTFGWTFKDMPEMNYSMVYTVEVDDKFMPKESGAINGGMTVDDPVSSPVLVITVKDIDASVAKLKKNGAEMVMEKTKVGDMGLYARFKDPEGNVLGVWQSLHE